MRLNFLSVRRSLLARLGNTGLVLGTLFFAASLTPSLTPRITVAQAVLSGMCLAAGYGPGSGSSRYPHSQRSSTPRP